MLINSLSPSSALAATDALVKETSAGVTQRIAASSVVENDLAATAWGKVLDARQGKALNDMIDAWYTSETGFSAACASAGLSEFVGIALDTLDSIIGQYSADTAYSVGISTSSGGQNGPVYFLSFGKSGSGGDYGGMLYGYYGDLSHVIFRASDGVYGVKAIF